MSQADLERLKADASGNTGLAEVLAESLSGFASPEDAVNFLASRGFDISVRELTDAAAEEARSSEGVGRNEGAYGALLRFMINH